MKKAVYGIFSITTTINGICYLMIGHQFFALMKDKPTYGYTLLGIAWILMMVTAVLFNDHIMKNEAIKGKWFHATRVLLLLTNPISFPLYWLYFFIIKKPSTINSGFPPARE